MHVGVGTSELGLYIRNTDYITIIIILLSMYCIILYSLGLNLYLTVAASLVAVPSSIQQGRERTQVSCLPHHHHRESLAPFFSFFLFGWSWWKYHQPHRDLTDVSIPSITDDDEEEERRRFLFSQSTHVEHKDVSHSRDVELNKNRQSVDISK